MSQSRVNTSKRNGFTLIELLVVIGIIALLIGILLPSLGAARAGSRAIKALANGRSVGQVFAIYANDYGSHPYMDNDSDLFGSGDGILFTWWPGNVSIGMSDPFSMDWAWPAAVAEIAPWEENYETWVSPGLDTRLPDVPDGYGTNGDEKMRAMISWRYSNSFVGDPGLWDPDATSPVTMSMYRSTRPSDVGHPSQKVMLWDTHLAWLQNDPPPMREGHWDAPTPMVFADGHADSKNPLEATPGTPNFLRFQSDLRLANTPRGVRGVDY